jgi:hypothetical protein
MNVWQDIGYELEAKVIDNSSVWVRNKEQENDYPHLIVHIDEQANIIGVSSSVSRAAMGSIEGTSLILDAVKEKLLQL